MAPTRAIGYIAVLLGTLVAATGCGKTSDKGPPPGAATDLQPPDIQLEPPTESTAPSTKK